MSEQKKRVYGILITLVGGAFWGLSGACGQYLFEYKGATAKWLVPIRLVVAGYTMLLFLVAKDGKKTFEVWKTKRNAVDIFLYGMGGMLLCQYTYFATIEHSNAGTATVLQYLSPVIIMAIVCIKQKKLPRAIELVAMICAMMGVFLIATHGDVSHLVISKEAMIYGIASAIAVVIYNLQPQNLMKQFSTPLLLAWAMVIGGTTLFFIFKPWRYSVVLDWQTIFAMIGIILFGTIVSFSCYMQGVKWIGASQAILFACDEPLVATLLSAIWLKASFQIMDFWGFVFIISTIFILSLESKVGHKFIVKQNA